MISDGLFHAEHEVLKNASKVYVKHCTSDSHMGNGESFGRQFRGARVVEAVLKDLVQQHGLGQGNQRELLLFGGGSSGARGAIITLDHVQSLLGAAANIDVVGFLDSPAWVDVEPIGPEESLQSQTKAVFSYANVSSSSLDPICSSTYTGDEAWRCIFPEYRLPFLRTPYFMVAFQYDLFQLNQNCGESFATLCSSEVEEYAEGLRTRTLQMLDTIASPDHAIFSPACVSHDVALKQSGFKEMTSAGVTMEDALVGYLNLSQTQYTNRTNVTSWVDKCTGLGCGNGCGQNTTTVCSIKIHTHYNRAPKPTPMLRTVKLRR